VSHISEELATLRLHRREETSPHSHPEKRSLRKLSNHIRDHPPEPSKPPEPEIQVAPLPAKIVAETPISPTKAPLRPTSTTEKVTTGTTVKTVVPVAPVVPTGTTGTTREETTGTTRTTGKATTTGTTGTTRTEATIRLRVNYFSKPRPKSAPPLNRTAAQLTMNSQPNAQPPATAPAQAKRIVKKRKPVPKPPPADTVVIYIAPPKIRKDVVERMNAFKLNSDQQLIDAFTEDPKLQEASYLFDFKAANPNVSNHEGTRPIHVTR
jgi:hypothetical protein